jgi:hypothetical protein
MVREAKEPYQVREMVREAKQPYQARGMLTETCQGDYQRSPHYEDSREAMQPMYKKLKRWLEKPANPIMSVRVCYIPQYPIPHYVTLQNSN